MIVNIEFLKVSDLESIDELSRRYKNTIGFFTKETFKDFERVAPRLSCRFNQFLGY
jgi:hypothetical protein